jgi:SET domain-containing protein 6
MDNFQTNTDRFLAWFKSVGGEFRDDLLEIQDLRAKDAGRGIGILEAHQSLDRRF